MIKKAGQLILSILLEGGILSEVCLTVELMKTLLKEFLLIWSFVSVVLIPDFLKYFTVFTCFYMNDVFCLFIMQPSKTRAPYHINTLYDY